MTKYPYSIMRPKGKMLSETDCVTVEDILFSAASHPTDRPVSDTQ